MVVATTVVRQGTMQMSAKTLINLEVVLDEVEEEAEVEVVVEVAEDEVKHPRMPTNLMPPLCQL